MVSNVCQVLDIPRVIAYNLSMALNDWNDRDEWNDKYARDWEDEQIADAKEAELDEDGEVCYVTGKYDDEN